MVLTKLTAATHYGPLPHPRRCLELAENRRSAFRRDKLKADIIIRLQSGAVSLVLTVSRLVGIPF
jgi:hypothetical protein